MKMSHYYRNSVSSKVTNTLIESGNISIYYSYGTIIAIKVDDELTISKNIWGTVTGKHLNTIDRDKSKRVENKVLQELVDKLVVTV